MKLSLCLEMVFRDRPFLERMGEARRLGYEAVEFWDWRDKDLDGMGREARRLGLTIAAMSGNRLHSLIDPAEREGLLEEMEQVFAVAERLGCARVMLLSDVLEGESCRAVPAGLSEQAKMDSLVEGLEALARRVEGRDLTLLLEPLNTVLDHRGCFLNGSAAAVAALERVNRPQVRLLYDVYHMTMMGEDAPSAIAAAGRWLGYVHAADVPGRHEPGSGTIPWRAVRERWRGEGYDGFIGLEFSPCAPDDEALRQSLEVLSG